MSAELLLAVAFMPVWMLLIHLFGKAKFNFLWNLNYSRPTWLDKRSAGLLILSRLLLFLYMAGIVLLTTRIVPQEYRLSASNLQLALISIFAISVDALLAWRRTLRERRAAGDDSKVHRRHNLITEMSITGVGMVLAIITIGQLLHGFQVIFAFFWISFIIAQRSGFGGNYKGPIAPFDESPILDELRSIGKPYGIRLKELKIKRSRKNGSLFRMPLLELVKEKKPIHTMVLPWENFIYLDPGATTLSFAMRWAAEVKPKSLASLIRSNIYVMFGVTFATMVGWFVMFYFTMEYLSRFGRTGRTAVGLAAFAGAVIIPLLITLTIGRLLGFYPGWRRAVMNAYESWVAAEKWEKRTLSDFVAMAAQYNAYQNQVLLPELAMLQIRRNRRILYLLKQLNTKGTEETERFFTEVETKLTLPFVSPPGTADENGKGAELDGSHTQT